MNSIKIKHLAAIGACKYQLQLIPSEPLYSLILELKEKYRQAFGWNLYANAQPHMSLTGFYLEKEKETAAIQAIETHILQTSIQLQTAGLSFFEESKVLHLAVANTAQTQKLKEALLLLSNGKGLFQQKLFQISPLFHLSIAKAKNKESATDLLSLGNDFQDLNFFPEEIVLKRKTIGGSWENCHRFPIKDKVGAR